MIELILNIVFYIVFAYLAFGVCYNYFFAVAAKMRPQEKYNFNPAKMHKFVILIPAYKEDRVIITVAKEARELNYASELFDVVVIADQLKKETIETIRRLGVTVVEVSFESSTKAKALNASLESLPDGVYDYAVVFDADNIAEKDFLLKINSSANDGFKAIQAHRTAKNQNTKTALLDAASEEVGNSMFRQGNRALGLPSALIGSGMAIEYSIFKTAMLEIRDVAGEDRELEVRLLKSRIDIEYLNCTMIYDEKVQSWDNFSTQRTRWTAAHVDFVKKYFFASWVAFFINRNFTFLNKMLQSAIIPKIPLLVSLFLFAFASLLIDFPVCSCMWIGLIIIYTISMMIAIPKKMYNKRLITAMLELPFWFFSVLKGAIKIKGQKNKFLHTEHDYHDLENKK